MASAFRNVIEFFEEIGLYDVVLPFLLVFTVVFAMLEKSRVLGYDEINGEKVPKKNLNSMVAFVIAFLTIASTKVVAVINEALSLNKPVISTTAVGAAYDLIENDVNGYQIEPDNPEELAKAIIKIIENRNKFMDNRRFYLKASVNQQKTSFLK